MRSTLIIIAFISFNCLCGAQDLNTEISNAGESPYLLGKIDRLGLEGPNYKDWFQKNYINYQPDTGVIEALKPLIKNYEILVFMGTWCGDSKREIPRLYKILNNLNYPMDQLTTVAVGRSGKLYKQSPQHEEEGLNIHRVPTFIIYKNDVEVNRIVEEPVQSLEKDLLNIITSNTYESNYAIVAAIDRKLIKGIKKLKKSEDHIIDSYRDRVSSMYELNTYAKVLMLSDRKEEALAVLQMNTNLFPNNANAFLSLSNNLMNMGREKEGLLALEKAAELAPDNQYIIKRLEQLRPR